MVSTKEMLDSYFDSNRITIKAEKYEKILCELGTGQDEDYSWTEQDIFEQLRKLLKNKNN